MMAAAHTAGHTSYGVRGECVGAMEQRREWAGALFGLHSGCVMEHDCSAEYPMQGLGCADGSALLLQVLYYNLDRRKLLQPTIKTYAARQLAVRVHHPVPLEDHLFDMPH